MRFILGLPAAHARGDNPSFPGTEWALIGAVSD